MTFEPLLKPSRRRIIGLLVTATAITGAIAVYGISQVGILSKSASQPVVKIPPVRKVTALGRLEPEAEVIVWLHP